MAIAAQKPSNTSDGGFRLTISDTVSSVAPGIAALLVTRDGAPPVRWNPAAPPGSGVTLTYSFLDTLPLTNVSSMARGFALGDDFVLRLMGLTLIAGELARGASPAVGAVMRIGDNRSSDPRTIASRNGAPSASNCR